MNGSPVLRVARHCSEMRTPTSRDRRYGTECSQWAWQRPPITRRSPDPGERSWPAHRQRIGEPVLARPQQPWSFGPEREHRDDRVVEPSHVGVPVETLAVGAVPVLDEAEAGELHPVVPLDRTSDLCERGAGKRGAPSPPRAQPPLLDMPLVPEQLGRRRCHRTCDIRWSNSASNPTSQRRDTSTHDVSSSPMRSTVASGSIRISPATGHSMPRSVARRTRRRRSG